MSDHHSDGKEISDPDEPHQPARTEVVVEPRDEIEHKIREGSAQEVNAASVALAAAIAADKPKLLSRSMLRLCAFLSIGYLTSTMNGFDSSLMGGINAMTSYQQSFGLNGAGSSSGIVFIIYSLGQIGGAPFCGLLADGLGRRWCIFIGMAIVLLGTAIETAANSLGMFMGGRFVLGFGASLATAAATTWTVELAHPAYRGIQAGTLNVLWWLGSILAGWTTYGTNLHFPTSSWAWRVPTLVQAGLPSVVLIGVLFAPESPRWLISHGKKEQGLQVLTKYHGDGHESLVVQLEYREIVHQMEQYRDENPWWDYRELVNTRAARYRLFMVAAMAFFGQWSGNNVISYFLPEQLKAAGITDPNKQLLINAISPIFSLIAAFYGATLLDRLGRRKMLMIGLSGALISFCFLTAFTAETTNNPNLSYGVIVFIYLFGICFSWGFTPLQTLYAVECLETRTRAKGSGINFLLLNIALCVNTYGVSVGLEAIGWKVYLVYIVWIVVELLVIYFFFVETAGKTLEELAGVFEAKNPRKESTKRTKIAVNNRGTVLEEPGSNKEIA